MYREEVIKEAEKRLSSVSFKLESGGNLNAGLRKIKEREYKFLRGVVFALRAQQIQLDKSRWEGCDWCNQRYCDNCFWQIKMKDSFRCKRCTDKSEWSPIVSYCSNCGRPLTEAAWSELEKRIGA